MYIHVGEEVTIKSKDIIAILDKESTKSQPFTNDFIHRQNELIVNAAKGSYKSVVITLDKVYYSPFSSGTLKKRSQVFSQHE
jgi:extracellular matrix regulatory protein B